jgi:hypothetical protein
MSLYLLLSIKVYSNCKQFMNNPLLNKNQILSVFNDKRLLEMMRVIMINDSASYSLFREDTVSEEINLNIDLLYKL